LTNRKPRRQNITLPGLMSVAQRKQNRPHAAARRAAMTAFVLTGCPLITHKALLRHILPKDNTGRIRLTDQTIGEGEALKIRTSVGKDSQRKPKRNLGLVPLDIPMCYSNETYTY